jgi:hypothetical protein
MSEALMGQSLPKPTRKHPRVKRRMKVVIAGSTSFTVDLSRSGFSTESMRVLPVGTLVRGTLHPEGGQIEFSGRIVWSHPGNLTLNIRGKMGVAFDQTLAELKAVGAEGPR